jgi:hypothetical protein
MKLLQWLHRKKKGIDDRFLDVGATFTAMMY